MNIKGCLTSNNQVWETPKDIYKMFMEHSYFDPCPLEPTFDGLIVDWGNKAFVNPPYKDLKLWVKKSIEEKTKAVMFGY